jgi:16S rRNA processing protein RimM
MTIEDCFFLGKVTKPHGVKGEVVLWLDVDFPEYYSEMDSVFLNIKDDLVPFFIDNIQIRGKKSIAKFEDMDSIEKTQPIIGLDMYLPLNLLPKLEGNKFYYHEVIGYTIFDKGTQQNVGTLKAIYEGSGQDLLAVDIEGKEALIPIVDEIISSVDHENKNITVDLPLGLIDLYLNP